MRESHSKIFMPKGNCHQMLRQEMGRMIFKFVTTIILPPRASSQCTKHAHTKHKKKVAERCREHITNITHSRSTFRWVAYAQAKLFVRASFWVVQNDESLRICFHTPTKSSVEDNSHTILEYKRPIATTISAINLINSKVFCGNFWTKMIFTAICPLWIRSMGTLHEI